MKDKVVNMDFASLYPTQQKWYNIKPIPERVIIRKARIKRIFN
jgi:DNA polymerase elongation subunit (family B)